MAIKPILLPDLKNGQKQYAVTFLEFLTGRDAFEERKLDSYTLASSRASKIGGYRDQSVMNPQFILFNTNNPEDLVNKIQKLKTRLGL